VLPAASVADTVTVLSPSTSGTLAHVTASPLTTAVSPLHIAETTGDPPADRLARTSIGEVGVVDPSAGDMIVSNGEILSMFSVSVAVAVFPLVSVAVPLTTWPAPSALTVIGAGHVCTAVSSAQANVTVTLVLFQPFALGAWSGVAVIVGGVVSVGVAFSPTISTTSDVPRLLRSSAMISLVPGRSVTRRVSSGRKRSSRSLSRPRSSRWSLS
jgi:hypothetical protein